MFFLGIGTYKGHFRAGNLQDSGIFEYLNGAIYDGYWKDNKKNGWGKLIEDGGDTVFSGTWVDDLKHGTGTLQQRHHYVVDGIWSKGILIEMTKFQHKY